MNTHFLKYASVITAPIAAYISMTYHGWWTYLTLGYLFILIPLLDALLPYSERNLTKAEEKILKKDPIYDYLLYALVPFQYAILIYFFFQVQEVGLSTFEIVGRVITMGLLCASIGINVAHELGHRQTKYEQGMSKALLLTTLYMHFFIEHNQGHHKNVSTDDDPASSRRGEIVYFFWFRSVINGYLSAWNLEKVRLAKNKIPFFSLKNQMIQYTLIQGAALAAIYFFFGWFVVKCFIVAATMGFLLLESINYVEHYGLRREKIGENAYEKVQPHHSWNSNHVIGRIMLFELTRHSDHHYNPSRKYQILRHFDQAPEMPTGYPGMILLSFIPPLWFYVMHKQIDEYEVRFAKFQKEQEQLKMAGV